MDLKCLLHSLINWIIFIIKKQNKINLLIHKQFIYKEYHITFMIKYLYSLRINISFIIKNYFLITLQLINDYKQGFGFLVITKITKNHQNYAKEVLEIVKKIQHKNNITKMTLSQYRDVVKNHQNYINKSENSLKRPQ